MSIRLTVGAGSCCGRGGGGRNHWSRPFSRSIKGESGVCWLGLAQEWPGSGALPPVGRTQCRGPFPLFLRAAGGPWMLTGTLEGLVHLLLPFEFSSVADCSAPQILLLCPTGNSSPVHLHPRIQNVSPLPSWSPNFSCPFPDTPQHQPP